MSNATAAKFLGDSPTLGYFPQFFVNAKVRGSRNATVRKSVEKSEGTRRSKSLHVSKTLYECPTPPMSPSSPVVQQFRILSDAATFTAREGLLKLNDLPFRGISFRRSSKTTTTKHFMSRAQPSSRKGLSAGEIFSWSKEVSDRFDMEFNMQRQIPSEAASCFEEYHKQSQMTTDQFVPSAQSAPSTKATGPAQHTQSVESVSSVQPTRPIPRNQATESSPPGRPSHSDELHYLPSTYSQSGRLEALYADYGGLHSIREPCEIPNCRACKLLARDRKGKAILSKIKNTLNEQIDKFIISSKRPGESTMNSGRRPRRSFSRRRSEVFDADSGAGARSSSRYNGQQNQPDVIIELDQHGDDASSSSDEPGAISRMSRMYRWTSSHLFKTTDQQSVSLDSSETYTNSSVEQAISSSVRQDVGSSVRQDLNPKVTENTSPTTKEDDSTFVSVLGSSFGALGDILGD